MPIRRADATWQGNLKDGNGVVRLGNGDVQANYNFTSRFESGEGGTNPEELIGGAEAACFSMALANDLDGAGFKPQSVDTTAGVHINKADAGWTVQQIDLVTHAEVPGIDQARLEEIAEGTRQNCPVGRLLAPGTTINLEIKLAG